MNIVGKIVLIVICGAAVLAGLFYLWMVIAFSPPKGPDDGTRHPLVKEGKLPGEVYFQILRVEKAKTVQHFEINTGMRNRVGESIGYSRLLRTFGAPTPIDVRLAGKQRVEVVFDGPLGNGSQSAILETSETYGGLQPYEVRDGKIGVAETW